MKSPVKETNHIRRATEVKAAAMATIKVATARITTPTKAVLTLELLQMRD
jgi:hypothetical protein